MTWKIGDYCKIDSERIGKIYFILDIEFIGHADVCLVNWLSGTGDHTLNGNIVDMKKLIRVTDEELTMALLKE